MTEGVSEMADEQDRGIEGVGPRDAAARITELRAEIDSVDERVVRLLNERARLSLSIRELKPVVDKPLYDPKREEQIFEHLASVNEGPLFDDDLRGIYDVILQVMKEL
jgi:chorismate mutase